MGDLQRPRLLEPVLVDRLARSPVVVLTGARQTGKTTLVRRFAGAGARRFETLDGVLALDQARRDPETLVAESGPVTIDEVQRAPELFLAIKRSVDVDRTPGRFLLTGSANLLLHARVGDSLAGRAIYLVMHPMTQREQRGDTSISPWAGLMAATDVDDALARVTANPGFDWRDAALAGGFPPAALSGDEVGRRIWWEGYVETYVQRDLRELASVSDLPAFVRLLRLVALRTGALVNYTELGRDAALGRSTAQRWLALLETSFLLNVVPAFASSKSKRLIKAPKVFAADTGLGLHLCGIRREDIDGSAVRVGVWLENLVLNDLLVWRELEAVKPGIFHYRSAGGEEIDFVVERGQRLLPIEVKAAKRVRMDDARVLHAFCEERGQAKCPFGVVLYDGAEPVRLSSRVVGLPLSALL